MAENKTKENDASVQEFLEKVEPEKKKDDALAILELMQEVTGAEPKMWGASIVGFGSYHYKYESGREGDFCRMAFSPRKRNISLYVMDGLHNYEDLLDSLGKHKIGKSCLYINKLADVDQDVLRELLERSIANMKELYPDNS